MTDDPTPIESAETPDPARPREADEPWSSVRLDADMIKVLAHPLRSRLLSALRRGGSATATSLAQQLDTNTGATSYHLRKLESVRLVEEAGGGRGRERWWQPTTQMHSWHYETVEGDPDGQAAAGWLREYYLHSFVSHAERWLAEHDAWPVEWRRVAEASDYILELTPSQLDAMKQELFAVVARHTAAAEAGPTDGETPERVLLYVYGFPERKDAT